MPWGARKKATLFLAAVVAGGIAFSVWSDQQERERLHEQNIVKAEQFKREFDRDIQTGATLEAVEQYLRTKPVKAQRSLDAQMKVEALRIEVVEGLSPFFGCGRYSVGVIAEFDQDRLRRTEATWWSFDCV